MRTYSLKQFLLLISLSATGCSMIEQQLGSAVPSMPSTRTLAAGTDALKAATLSDKDTIEMARKLAAELDGSNQIATANSVYARRLAKLVSGHTSEDGLKLNYKVYIDPEVNAFSLADGTVRVHSGLMDRMTDEQVLFVIGHEVGHIKSGHAKNRLQRAYAASAATGLAGSYAQSATGAGLGGVAAAVGSELLAEMAGEVIKAQFSQSDELESDDYGVYFLARNGKRPEAALEALKTIEGEAAGDDSGMVAQFISTHPAGKERLENAALVIASLGSRAPASDTRMAKRSAGEPRTDDLHEQKAHKAGASAKGGGTLVASNSQSVKQIALKAPVLDPELPSSRVTQSAGSGWYIQLGAFPDSATAESMRGALRDRSERVTLQSTVVKGSQYERVLVGPYPTRQNAVIELDRVVSHGIFEGEPFVRHLAN